MAGPLAGRRVHVGGGAADGVGLDLQVGAGGRGLQSHQGARGRDAEDAAPAPEPRGGDGDQGQIRPLVLADHGAAYLDAPHLVALGPVAQRLERHHHLDGPAAVEAPRLHVPHRVPVAVGVALVGDGLVDEAAGGVGVEEQGVAPVVERVDEEAEQVVVQHVERVAAHLGRRPLARRRAVPAAARDVEVLVVEHHPRLGALGGGRALVGQLLDEVGHRRHGLVDRLVEPPVDAQRGQQRDGAHGGLAAVAGDHRGRRRRGRAVDDDARLDRGELGRLARGGLGRGRGREAEGRGQEGRRNPSPKRGSPCGGGPTSVRDEDRSHATPQARDVPVFMVLQGDGPRRALRTGPSIAHGTVR